LQLHHPEWVGKKEKQEKAVKDTHCYIPILSGAISPDTQDFQYNFSLKK
jgi:hypothetical protein